MLLNGAFLQLFKTHMRHLCTSVKVPIAAAPLMGNDVLEHIKPITDAVVLDMTFGSGGHSEFILNSDPSVTVLALDRDPISYAVAEKLADKYPGRLIPLLGKFSDLPALIEPLGYVKETIDVMLFHYGCSDLQMEDPKRGFSYLLEGHLDMRMDGDKSEGVSALDVLQSANEIDLKNIFKIYGCLSQGKKIARALLQLKHTSSTVMTTTDFVQLLSLCNLSNKEIRSAFRSLRYFVNDELNELNFGILLAEWYLKKGGRLATLSEAYLDDLVVKSHVTGSQSSNFVEPLPMEFSSYTAPLESETISRQSSWIKLNKHVIIPEGERLMAKTSKLRALVKA